MKRIFLLFGLLSALSPVLINTAIAVAQSGGYAGAYQRMGFGPRGMAMGNAMSAVPYEGIYGHYNPAHAALISDHIQIDISSAVMEFDRNLHSVNAHLKLPPNAGLNISLMNARVGNIDGRTLSGYHTSTLVMNEYQLGTRFGVRLHNRVMGGFGLKLNFANYHEDLSSAVGLGLDGGFLFFLNNNWSVALVLQDLLANYQWNVSEIYAGQLGRTIDQPFPLRLRFGIATTQINQLLLSAEYEIQVQHSEFQRTEVETTDGRPRVFTSTEEIRTDSHFIRFGARYHLHERFTLRSGVQIPDLDFNPVA